MTRYLDREPQVGDRVHVEYEAEYLGGSTHKHDVSFKVASVLDYMGTVPITATVRVIAPEPKVGDVVTADMDLPEGSIIEGTHRPEWTSLLMRRSGEWHGYGEETDTPYFDAPHWRIVRIGDAK